MQMADSSIIFTPRKVPASEDKLKLLNLESNFYRTCNAVRENGIELQKIRNVILNEMLQLEVARRQEIHQAANEKIKQLQVEKEQRCDEIKHLRDALKSIVHTGEVVEVHSTTVDEEDNPAPSLQSQPTTISPQEKPEKVLQDEPSSHCLSTTFPQEEVDLSAPEKSVVVLSEEAREKRTSKHKKKLSTKDKEVTQVDVLASSDSSLPRTEKATHKRTRKNKKETRTAVVKEQSEITSTSEEEGLIQHSEEDEGAQCSKEGKERNPEVIPDESSVTSLPSKRSILGRRSRDTTSSAEDSSLLTSRRKRRRQNKPVLTESDEDGESDECHPQPANRDRRKKKTRLDESDLSEDRHQAVSRRPKATKVTTARKGNKTKVPSKKNADSSSQSDIDDEVTDAEKRKVPAKKKAHFSSKSDVDEEVTAAKKRKVIPAKKKADSSSQSDEGEPTTSVSGPSTQKATKRSRGRPRKRVVLGQRQRRKVKGRSSVSTTSSIQSEDRDVHVVKSGVSVAELKVAVEKSEETDRSCSNDTLDVNSPPASEHVCQTRSTKINKKASLVLDKIPLPGGPEHLPSSDSTSQELPRTSRQSTRTSRRGMGATASKDIDSSPQETLSAVDLVSKNASKTRTGATRRSSRKSLRKETNSSKESEPLDTQEIDVSQTSRPKPKRRVQRQKKENGKGRRPKKEKQAHHTKASLATTDQYDKASNITMTSQILNPEPSSENTPTPIRSISPEIPLQNTPTLDSSKNSNTSSEGATASDLTKPVSPKRNKPRKSLDQVLTRLRNSSQKAQTPPSPPQDDRTTANSTDNASPDVDTTESRNSERTSSTTNPTSTVSGSSVGGESTVGIGKRKQRDETVSFAAPTTKRRRTAFLSKKSKNSSMFHLSIVDDKEASRRRTALAVNTRGIIAPKLKTTHTTNC